MKKITLIALILSAFALPGFAAEFAIKKIDVDNPISPDYTVPGQPAVRWTAQKWVRIETVFDAAPDLTDELQFNYYVYIADRLLVGRVTHVSVAKGQALHSVMYISPKSLLRIMQKKQVNIATLPITQVSVTITKPGVAAPLAVGHLKPGAQGEWWTTLKQEEGFLMNKTETPFAPLWWDYYESVKPTSAR